MMVRMIRTIRMKRNEGKLTMERFVHILRSMSTKPTERLTLLLTPDELRIVEEFRFSNRFQHRNDAIRELIKRGVPELMESQQAAG